MVQFTTLRLSGFKSFVDPTELEISPGLTGIVGPNGCGKSNLLEAIRWCMGEGSAKKLRGGGMDDVIFAGSGHRPARNIAEVVLKLDNQMRDAPAAFNDHEEIEVARRIEREQGSSYTVNGADVRARDVQLMFADLSTGAKSAAIVSQGRVASVISAKPQDRRQLLEEAAGITGLHSRRHEAELRLKAAETNLERLEDVVTALEGQMQNLKRQARQATRYKNLSGHIRRAEAMVLHLRWAAALAELDAARQALAANTDRVGTLTTEAARAAAAQAETSEKLPGLRTAEAEAGAALHRLVVERDSLEAEEARLKQQQDDARTLLAQTEADLARERAFLEEAAAAESRLGEEADSLADAQATDAESRQTAESRVAELAAQVQDLENRFTQVTQKVAAEEARRADLDRRIDDLTRRIDISRRQNEDARAEAAGLRDQPNAIEAENAERAVAEAEAAVERAQTAADDADQHKSAAEGARAEADSARAAAEDEVTRLRAEVDALAAIAAPADHGFDPALSQIRVAPGYEAALGAALGDDLEYAVDPAAPGHWRDMDNAIDMAPLPPGGRPMTDFVDAPRQLRRRLRQIAVAETVEAAAALVAQLRQGQRLVTPDGTLWRWDGLHVAAGTPSAAETRLKQRNRLDAARRELDDAEATLATATAQSDAARQAFEAAADTSRDAASALRTAFVSLSQARERADQASRAVAEQRSRLKVLEAASVRLTADITEAEGHLAEARTEREALASGEAEREELARLRDDLAGERQTLGDAQQVLNRLVAEAEARDRRLASVKQDIADWQRRRTNAEAQIEQLAERRERIAAQIDSLDSMPDQLAERRQALLSAVADAERARNTAADMLAEAEQALRQRDGDLKRVERELADAREEKGRREGAVAQGEAALESIGGQIAEKLDCAPEQTLAIAEHGADAPLPDLADSERKLERLLRERDNMGPVNLRAEQESEELQQQIETYATEQDDLVEAIEKFRRAIADLNREGKQRLLASFDKVNTHFQELFTRLFGGGRAHLELTDMDDPLNAGIEIMASPPGKKLQNLGLLSGGEQALTALSLLFAVFLTNPAPICILDEVDAPLDDSNVDRFCSLVEDIARRTETRFLVVTHHRMTMARVDRLYGVTMAEQGVSQLVSVDLQEAVEMRATA